MTKQSSAPILSDLSWRNLYFFSGIAAIIAGAIFRRNIAVEVGIFIKNASPVTAIDWFSLLQSNRLLGLTYLHVFDLVNYIFVGLMFLGLYAAFKQTNKSSMAVALTLALLGVVTYFSSNTAFSMLSLSNQYLSATTDLQRNQILVSVQSMLALNRFSGSAHPGSGGLISLLFIALAGMITSIVMFRNTVFKGVTAYVGVLASALDIIYCFIYIFIPSVDVARLAVLFIPVAGLLLMIWHILIGWRLCRLGRSQDKQIPKIS